jgi:adenosylcobinamide-phosphate synthase
LAFALDGLVRDPQRRHPVAAFGSVAAAFEPWTWRDDRGAGVRYVVWCVGLPTVAAAIAQVLLRRGRVGAAALAGVTWVTLGGASLRREGRRMAALLRDGDLVSARAQLGHLCGRDPSTLDSAELARATVESVAENTSDAVVAPLCWAAAAGLPGVVGYRAINTLDAMVGHRTDRYRRFGWAAARLDDGANLVPARLTTLLTCVLAPVVGGKVGTAARVVRRDGRRHPSPNAGLCESAFAGALGVRLGGVNTYDGSTEHRGPHGDGGSPTVGDIDRSARLSAAVGAAAAAVLAVLTLARSTGRARRACRGRIA